MTVRVRVLALLSKTNIRRWPRTAPSEIAEPGVSARSFRRASGRSPLAPYLPFYRQAAGWHTQREFRDFGRREPASVLN